MKKNLFILLAILLSISTNSILANPDHSNCHDPHCLGLLAVVGVDFTHSNTVRITLPTPPEGVKSVYGACNARLENANGNEFIVELTFDELTLGARDVSFDVVTNAYGSGTSVEIHELIYYVELEVRNNNWSY